MNSSTYQTPVGAKAYLEFIQSEDGKIHQEIIGQAVSSALKGSGLSILDVGCGSGWLTHLLKTAGNTATGIDSSPLLIKHAAQTYPDCTFRVADITEPLSETSEFFDVVVLVCASLDVTDLAKTYENIFGLLKPGGQFISVIVNPYYTSPVGKWKRGLTKLFGKKPRLILDSYVKQLRTNESTFTGGIQHNMSHFYSLSEQINTAIQAGFTLASLADIVSPTDSPHYNLRYRLYRFPLFLLAEFKK